MKKSSAIMLSLGFAVTSFAGISSASATSLPILPTTDSLFALNCHGTPSSPGLFSVDVSNGHFTQLGTNHDFSGSECAYQPAFNPTTGKSYFLAGNTESGFWGLVSVSTTTGEMTLIHNVRNSSGDFMFQSDGNFPGEVIITKAGVAYLIAFRTIYPLNLKTAMIGAAINSAPFNSGMSDVYSAACSPTSDACYVLTEHGELFPINLSQGTLGASLGTIPSTGNYSMQIDSNDRFWVSTFGSSISSFLASGPAMSFIQGPFMAAQSGAILITTPITGTPETDPVPALANTGANSNTLLLTAFGGLLLALAGVVLVLFRPTTRRTHKN